MNQHQIIILDDGSEWDLVLDDRGRFLAFIPQDDDDLRKLTRYYKPTNRV